MLDVMVFTAHRRGEYLMDRLAALDIRFQTFDFSYRLGERDEKDLLGPFGLFEGEKWSPSHRRWLDGNYVFSRQKQGWSAYTDQGTIEASGLFANHQKQVMSDWVSPMTRSMYSTVDEPINAIKAQPPICDLFSPYNLPWALENPKAKLMDVDANFQFESQPGLKKLTFQNTTYSAPFLMNFLAGSELMSLQKQGLTKLLAGEALKPRQSWQRAEILLSADVDLDVVPLQTVVADQLNDPWLEERFFILQRQENDGYYSVWYRSWYERHKSAEHFKTIANSIEQVLKARIPGAKVQWVKSPLEVENETSVSLFPVYDQKEWTLQNKWLENGVYSGGPDKLESYLWSHNMSHQSQLAQHFSQEYKK